MLEKFNFVYKNKFVVCALLVVSTILVAFTALFAMQKIQEELFQSYSSFGQILTKTLAVQSFEITKDLKNEKRTLALDNYVKTILGENKDISFITFKDKGGEILYTKKNGDEQEPSKVNITTPMLSQNGEIMGTIEIGLNAKSAKNISSTTKNSIFFVFTFVWILFLGILIINTIIANRELSFLHKGVKAIGGGNFGTTIEYDKAHGEVKELFSAFNDMSKRLHIYEEQNVDTLTFEKNKLEAILMGIINGVVVCDKDNKITLLNNSAMEILNIEKDEILNTQIDVFCDMKGEICFSEPILKFKQTPLQELEKNPLEVKVNINERVIKTIISPLYSKMHDYLGYTIILIDITKEAEIDKLKSDFISNVSHELRTPLTVLSTYSDTLYNFGNDFNFEEQREFIGTINENVVRLNKMVNDILDFSKAQANAFCEKNMYDFGEIVEKTVENLKILSREKNLTFEVSKEENLPSIPLNREIIERALNNLITNAIKYTKNDTTIKICVKMTENKDMLEFSIEDKGCGISNEHIEKIFDRFYRVENDTHTIKGTGLGLHLTKIGIEKQHGGEVFVYSKIDEGSTFGFRLPISVENEHLENFKKKEKVS